MATTPKARSIIIGGHLINLDAISNASMMQTEGQPYLMIRMIDGYLLPVKDMTVEGLNDLINGAPF